MDHLIVDTSALLAYFDSAEPDHGVVQDVIESCVGLLVVSPYVLAELDYLIATRHGVEAELAVLGELSGGAWELAALDAVDVAEARQVVATYSDQDVGLADASIVVLAQRYSTTDVCTLDRRHFNVLRARNGDRLMVVP